MLSENRARRELFGREEKQEQAVCISALLRKWCSETLSELTELNLNEGQVPPLK